MTTATSFEYRHRFLLHGLIYTLCLAAPWPGYHNGFHGVTAWGFLRNGSVWFELSNHLARPVYSRFAAAWNGTLIGITLFALAGALLRTWGAAYLGATTVQRAGMVGDRVVADGPYRYLRNPLYLGTILHTVALACLMRPDAAVLCLVLITLLQFRLIGREEPYLQENIGDTYRNYMKEVPRILPSLRARTAPGTSRPDWKQGVLSEVYMLGVAVTFASVGWTNGYSWETAVVRVTQGVIISLGASVVVRAFIPRASY